MPRGIDEKTVRPIQNPGIRYSSTGKPVQTMPGADGAHTWHPMAFNPKTGLTVATGAFWTSLKLGALAASAASDSGTRPGQLAFDTVLRAVEPATRASTLHAPAPKLEI